MNDLKKFAAGVLIATLFLPFIVMARGSGGTVHVNGYYRSNGTYVQPHYRSAPDGNPYNNWSYPGNTNPYTGKVAPGNPDTYLRNYYDRSGGSSYSLPSYSAQSPSFDTTPTPAYSVPSHSLPSYSTPSTEPTPSPVYSAPAYSFSKPRQKLYARAKQAVDTHTGCNTPGLIAQEISDCFRYAYNKDSFDWEVDYSTPQQQTTSQPSVATQPTKIELPQIPPTIQTASIFNSQTEIIRKLQEQIAALQLQLNALLPVQGR